MTSRMFMRLIVAALALGAAGARAAPAVTHVSGTVADGHQITISGSGFGTGPALLLFDDFGAGTVGQTHGTTATVGTWNDAEGVVWSDPLLSNGQGVRVMGSPGALISRKGFPVTDEVFFSFIDYVPDGYKFPAADAEESWPDISALKSAWLYHGQYGYSDTSEPDMIFVTYNGAYLSAVGSNDGCGLSTFDINSDNGWLWDTPIRYAFWVKGNGLSAQGSDGFFKVTNGETQINRSYHNYKAWFCDSQVTNVWDRMTFIGYIRSWASFADGHNFVMDDIYLATGDNAQARVEIGDASTYTACTRLALATTGSPGDSWASSSITATVREGTFTPPGLANGYLYVITGDGSVNASGYPLAPSAPVRASVRIDLGTSGYTTPSPWNNLTDKTTSGSIANLTDRNGHPTPWDLNVTDAFPFDYTGGTTAPGVDYPATATRDTFLVANGNTTGAVKISDLDAGKRYNLTFFGSRMNGGDNRESQYTVTGATATSVCLDVNDNQNQTVSVTDMRPNGSGEITIKLEKGPNNTNPSGYAYLGVIEIAERGGPLVITVCSSGTPGARL